MSRPVAAVLVGRDAEWSRLADAAAVAGAGVPTVAVVRGEAGIGKTRLVADWSQTARDDGAVVAVGRCIEVEGAALPLAPVAGLLRDLVRQLGGRAVLAAAGSQWPVVTSLVPELNGTAPPAPTHVQTFDAVAGLVRALTSEGLLVLVLEDVHWSDSLTRDLLGYLARAVDSARLLVVLTTRPDLPDAVDGWLAELVRLPSTESIDVTRLGPGDVTALAAALGAAALDGAALDRLITRSDGVPFLVEELVADRAAPEAAGHLLLRRWRRLGDQARAAVAAASLADTELTDRLLRAVLAGRVDHPESALREAVDGGVLVAAPERDGYRFRHALLREAVSTSLLPGEARAWHRRWAEALDQAPRALDQLTSAVASARHWDGAGDAVRALASCLTAAEQCRLRAAYVEQSRLLLRALACWDDVPAGADVGREMIVEEAINSLAAAEAIEEIISLAESELRRTHACDALRRAMLRLLIAAERSDLTFGSEHPDLADLDELLNEVTSAPPSRARTLAADYAAWALTHIDPERALAMSELAVETADALDDEDLSARMRSTRAYAFAWLGQADRALREHLALLPDIDRLGSSDFGNFLANMVSLNLETGRLEAALSAVAEARRRLGDELQAPQAWGQLTIYHAEALAYAGRWDDATRVLVSAQPRYSDAGWPWHRAFRALLAAWRGDIDGATKTAEGVELSADGPMSQWDYGGWLRATIGAARGDLTAVRAEVAVAARKTDIRAAPDALHLLLVAATAEADEAARARALGDRDALAASERINAALRDVLPRATWPGPGPDAWRLHIAAELDRWSGSTDPAPWQATIDAYAPLGYPHERGWALLHLAEALVEHDRRDEAAAAAGEAAEIAERLGARPLADEVASLVRRARLSTAPVPDQRPPAAVDRLGLTDREREVLALLCEGLTNPAIAKRLYMSPKTASVHVSRILTKLGATNRTAAAAAAHRLGLDHAPR